MTAISGGGRSRGLDLGPHLARGSVLALEAFAAELHTDTLPPGPSRGLISASIEDQIRELEAGANTRRTRKPLYHVHCDPRFDDEELVELFWRLFEQEFGLTRARFASQRHNKGDRGAHTHRVYDITRADGSLVNMRNDYYRREKIMVLACFLLGRKMPPVPHLQTIRKALTTEGRIDVVEWMEKQPPAPRAVAQRTPAERQAEQRTGAHKAPVMAAVMAAWTASDGAAAFVAALQSIGLDLAQGDSAVMVVDGRKGEWPVVRLIGQASRERGERIKAATVHARVHGLSLLTIDGAREAIRARARATAEAEAARQAKVEADRREAARRRATVARVPAEMKARAAEVRASLAAIKAERPEEPPDVVEARKKVASTTKAKGEAEARQANTKVALDELQARRTAYAPWWRRLMAWSTGETARIDAAITTAREPDAEAGRWVTVRTSSANTAEVRRDIAVRKWKAEVVADKALRADPLREELSYCVRALELLQRDPQLALLPEPELRAVVEADTGGGGPLPKPK